MANRVKRVLYAAYYFPPAGGPGVQRTLKFVRYLPLHGWTPTVISVHPDHAAWPALDSSMLAEVPTGVDVRRTRSRDPYAAYARLRGRSKADSVGVGFADDQKAGWKERVARFVRANLFIPDARIGWLPFLKEEISRCLSEGSYDALITSGPPHSTHLAGIWASKKFGIPWLADFRDPWAELSYYDELPFLPWSRRLDGRHEANVLKTADSVVTVSPAIAGMIRKKSDQVVRVIPNGYDPEDFENVDPIRGEGFRVVHVGTLTAGQDPGNVWAQLAGLRRAGLDVRVTLVGRVDSDVVESIAGAGLSEALELVPYVEHSRAVAYMKGADLLLLCVPRTKNDTGILTGKVFEYLAAGRPILGLGPTESDVSGLLNRSGQGSMLAYEDAGGIRAALEKASAQESGGPGSESDENETLAGPPGSQASLDNLKNYARPSLAGQLATELNRIMRT
jgi:glycosyltransferase involved in cell wall biosynthesis